MDEEFDIERFMAELHADVPEIHRLGFFSDFFVDYNVDFAHVAAKLKELAEARGPFTDEFGYDWRVTDHVMDEESRRAAWVEHKERVRGAGYEEHVYWLKARIGSTCFKWEIETYNPYFGCFVRHLRWFGDAVVIVYDEKYHTYAARLTPDGSVQRILARFDATIDGRVLTVPREGADAPERYSLPGLERLG